MLIPQTNTVITLAAGYDMPVYKRFVGSLRKTGFDGKILMGIAPGQDPQTLGYLQSQNVTCFVVETTICNLDITPKTREKTKRCAQKYDKMPLVHARYQFAVDWLNTCAECNGMVLVTDARDLFFQSNPFVNVSSTLMVFEENPKHKTTHWVVKTFVKNCFDRVLDETMLCSGTTMGPRNKILLYLNKMVEEYTMIINPLKRFSESCINELVDAKYTDQSLHNWLYYSGALENVEAVPHRTGAVHTIGIRASEIFEEQKRMQGQLNPMFDLTQLNLTNENGYFCNLDKTTSPVVHQFDRFGPRSFNAWWTTVIFPRPLRVFLWEDGNENKQREMILVKEGVERNHGTELTHDLKRCDIVVWITTMARVELEIVPTNVSNVIVLDYSDGNITNMDITYMMCGAKGPTKGKGRHPCWENATKGKGSASLSRKAPQRERSTCASNPKTVYTP